MYDNFDTERKIREFPMFLDKIKIYLCIFGWSSIAFAPMLAFLKNIPARKVETEKQTSSGV